MPAIVKPKVHFDVLTYTGNGSTQTIGGLSFQPDFVWIKSRSSATDHKLTDSVRGVTKGLISNSTGAETTDTNGITAFTSSGFTLGSDSVYNTNGATYVAWCWKANGSATSNTAGSITSTVSANPTAGFSVVTYKGTGSAGTVGHGLGVAPKMIIVKRTSSPARDWRVYHVSISSTGSLALNLTDATDTNIGYWNNTSPTSSVFSLGNTGDVNTNALNYVAYCFSEVAGYSKFGSYTGNGSADGTLISTGFKPKFVMTKRTDAGGGWRIFNTNGQSYNQISTTLEPNSAGGEANQVEFNCDWLSNGFKLRMTYADINASGGSFIYMAFAEVPFKYSLAR